MEMIFSKEEEEEEEEDYAIRNICISRTSSRLPSLRWRGRITAMSIDKYLKGRKNIKFDWIHQF